VGLVGLIDEKTEGRKSRATVPLSSVADPDPGSGAFLPQGSGMIFFPDPGSLPRPKVNISSRFYL
jgi:hypothetical protein